jgi:hypothetical protein
MDEFPIAGDIASKISSAAGTGRLVLPDTTRIKRVAPLRQIEVDLRTAFAGNFPEEPLWQPPVVSETMYEIAEFVNNNFFVLLLLLKNMSNPKFPNILLQFIYNTKKVFLDDPFPETENGKKSYVIVHILDNIMSPNRSDVFTFKRRDDKDDPQRVLTFDFVNKEFNLKQKVEPPDEKAGITGNMALTDAKKIMAVAKSAIRLMEDYFVKFVAENPSAIADTQPGTDGMISFFESRVIPKISEIIEQTNRPRAVFPEKLVVAINDIVYRFDRQLLLDGLQGMQYDDIYLLDERQRSYFVAAVQKYLIYLKIAGNPRHTTLQVDTAKKAPTTVVCLAILNHFQNWKGGQTNKPRFL